MTSLCMRKHAIVYPVIAPLSCFLHGTGIA
ncbi:hypothetical protein QE320_gp062 [Pseudomonas phage EM]|uniref:Uncharacterized protein n=1 Tax=Pseudomonas phage EM TaxID=2936914 RepID=A0AAE9HI34_9CAUD|nr:hypothetical protein QE320_gp001 [Pseudomonas phage EM]YP_010761779.1 hypothetical protein QE320_gp062 [Pseudomonas phage EM]UPW35803.1 hypothetical protein EM_001 [Pseudomonas phage EM]UPW35992.1 hypothetical protein EM_207 [Pseudomonas phage EM]